MSPLLRTSEVAGMIGLRKKRQPNQIKVDDFFGGVTKARKVFADLVGADQPDQCVVIPSVSYAIANAVANIPLQSSQNIVLVGEQFPSNYYSWERRAKEVGATIRIIKKSESGSNEEWNQRIREAIDAQTQIVSMAHVHWADGTIFDLKEISDKVHAHEGYLIVDGTQSIGALPFSIADIQPDLLAVASYKWMLGPYSIGMAYYGDRFLEGLPIEDSWFNRLESDDFANLVNYQDTYRSGALRYEVGEAPNFILLPMMIAGIEQLLEWSPKGIQDYCRALTTDSLIELREYGYNISNSHMAAHLFGIRLGEGMSMDRIKEELHKENVIVSYRGDAIRVSPSIYTETYEMETLIQVLKSIK